MYKDFLHDIHMVSSLSVLASLGLRLHTYLAIMPEYVSWLVFGCLGDSLVTCKSVAKLT